MKKRQHHHERLHVHLDGLDVARALLPGRTPVNFVGSTSSGGINAIEDYVAHFERMGLEVVRPVSASCR